MTTDQVLDSLRLKISEIETETLYDNDELLGWLEEARRRLSVRRIPTMANYTIVAEQGDPAYGITPEPTESDGELLIVQSAWLILDEQYRNRLKRGALAVTWASGLEQGSTVSADTAWKRMLSAKQDELNETILLVRLNATGFRSQ